MINKESFSEAVKFGEELLKEAKANRQKVEVSIATLSAGLKDYTKGAVSCYLHPLDGGFITYQYSGGEKFNIVFSAKTKPETGYTDLNVATLEFQDKDWVKFSACFSDGSSFCRTTDGGFDATLLDLLKLPSTINTINYLVEHEE